MTTFRKLHLIVLALLLARPASLISAEQVKRIFPYPYRVFDLPNGLRTVIVLSDDPSIVSVYVVVQVGSRNEVEPGKSGFAHFFEHMMFRGTKKYPPERYDSILKRIGAASNAFTTDDYTAYHTTFLAEDLEIVMQLEADRFQNLSYTEDVFRTEALAVLGEYNKSSQSPWLKLNEALRKVSFRVHPYRHTTIGFLEDIKRMPELYDYSLEFFRRYYRPEKTILVIVGKLDPDYVSKLVEKYWGNWERGGYQPVIPQETELHGPHESVVQWPTQTLPWIVVAFRSAPFSDSSKEMPALDLISFLGFSETSELYQKLVIREQKVDILMPYNPDRIDPYLFAVYARVKKEGDLEYVENEILATFARFREQLVDRERLEQAKKHLRYRFLMALDNAQAIAEQVAHYVALTRSVDTIDRLYTVYDSITAEDLKEVANKYFIDKGRTIVRLVGRK